MNQSLKVILICLLALGLHLNSRAGGPWTQAKGEGIAIGNISPVIYTSYSSPSGDAVSLNRRVLDISNQIYFEIGLHDRLNLIGNANLKYVGTTQKVQEDSDFGEVLENGRLFGMGNSVFGLKYRITNGSFLLATSFQIEFPGSSEKSLFGLRTGYDSWSFVPGIHMGQGFNNGIYYFVEAFFAAQLNISHVYRIKGELGYDFKKPLIMAFAVSVVESLKDKTVAESPNFAQTGLYLNNQEYISWELKFIGEINDHLGMTAGLAGGFRTELIARTPVISAGVYFKWDGARRELLKQSTD